MSIKEAAEKLAAAWAAKKFRNEAESRKSPEARGLRLALVEAGLTHRAVRTAAAGALDWVLHQRGCFPKYRRDSVRLGFRRDRDRVRAAEHGSAVVSVYAVHASSGETVELCGGQGRTHKDALRVTLERQYLAIGRHLHWEHLA